MQAVENYDQAINLSPDFTHAFIRRALAHAALGNEAEAQQDTDRAVELGANREQMEARLTAITEQR